MTHIASVLARFGNVREAATKIGRPPSVIQYWRTTGRIPATAMGQVLDAARRHEIAVDPAELIPGASDAPTHGAAA
ncbi:carph-isopro domain-containing protein [Sphingopyxis macrogoltabida]|nr:hypothetical protein [Sphingopyxis macrogoltabida]